MKFFLIVLSMLMLTSCGYKPSSHYIKKVFPNSVYVEVDVDTIEPENTPYIKDEMNRLVYTRFKGRVTSKKLAQSKIFITYKGTKYTPLAYKDGYVTRYRADVYVKFRMEDKEGMMKKSIHSRVESDIQTSSLTSSTLRTEAIRQGLAKALDEFIGYISAKGMQNNREKNTEVEKTN